MHLTLAQSFAAISTAAVGWLMVSAGAAKGALSRRTPQLCAACGRRRGGRSCHCLSGD
jgi:hypothetical protein